MFQSLHGDPDNSPTWNVEPPLGMLRWLPRASPNLFFLMLSLSKSQSEGRTRKRSGDEAKPSLKSVPAAPKHQPISSCSGLWIIRISYGRMDVDLKWFTWVIRKKLHSMQWPWAQQKAATVMTLTKAQDGRLEWSNRFSVRKGSQKTDLVNPMSETIPKSPKMNDIL